MFHRDASAMSNIVLQMHSGVADNVIYWKLCVWLPKTFVWCVMGVIRQRRKNTPWTVYSYHIYIYDNLFYVTYLFTVLFNIALERM